MTFFQIFKLSEAIGLLSPSVGETLVIHHLFVSNQKIKIDVLPKGECKGWLESLPLSGILLSNTLEIFVTPVRLGGFG